VVVADGVAQAAAGEQVDHRGQIQRAPPGADHRDITAPHLARALGGELPFHPVRRRAAWQRARRGHPTETPIAPALTWAGIDRPPSSPAISMSPRLHWGSLTHAAGVPTHG
jgi:hypothetical protein